MNEKPEKIVRSEPEWRTLLTQEQYQVLRERGRSGPLPARLLRTMKPGIITVRDAAHCCL